MDPLSIAASACQVAVFANGLAQLVHHFVHEYKNIPRSVVDLHDELNTLKHELSLIQKLFEKRGNPRSFEREHHGSIFRIIRNCEKSLGELERQLPELKDKTSPIQKIVLTLEKSMKNEHIREIRGGLKSYTAILNLSLTSASLGLQLDARESQEQIQRQIRELANGIRSAQLFSGCTGKHGELTPSSASSIIENDFEVIELEEKSPLDEDIKAWRKTADDVATAISDSLTDIPVTAFDNDSIPPDASVSRNNLSIYEDTFDPEPDHEDTSSPDVLELSLQQNQQLVRKIWYNKTPVLAASFQRHGIELRKKLSQAQDEEGPLDDLVEMEEMLADILLDCDSRETDDEAKELLQRLLKAEVSRTVDQKNEARRCRLYHKLGNLYFKYGGFSRAHKFVERAFKSRKHMVPLPEEDVAESAELLMRIEQSLGFFDNAGGLREWMRKNLRRPSDSMSLGTVADNVSINLPNAYQWCKEQGLRVHPAFRFDEWAAPAKTTPIHLAVEAEHIEVLRDMLSYVPHVEQHDENNSTPLHQAAAKRNRHITGLLLKRNANVNVRDRNERLPLHRCQAARGGVQVAKLLLGVCPELVDERDGFGKTALFTACEMGNEPMVKYLLEAGANPNIPGPGGCTPLMAVIEDGEQHGPKIAMVKLLLHGGSNGGANPLIPDRNGRTALDAANNTGLLAKDIKSLLKAAALNFPRRNSGASVTTTIRSWNSSTTRSSASR